MKTGHGIEIFDPYEWLPEYGETSVRVRTEGTSLVVTVTYDGETGELEREITFAAVCSYYSQIFPGPSMLAVEEGEAGLLLRGVLVEYPDSEAALLWTQHFGVDRMVRHYGIVFLAENFMLNVFSGDVSVSESVHR